MLRVCSVPLAAQVIITRSNAPRAQQNVRDQPMADNESARNEKPTATIPFV